MIYVYASQTLLAFWLEYVTYLWTTQQFVYVLCVIYSFICRIMAMVSYFV